MRYLAFPRLVSCVSNRRWNSWTALSVVVSWHKLDFVLFSTLIFLLYTMLFMDRLEFSCFGDFLQGYLKPEKTMVFFKIHQKKGLWIAWSKRLESLVKLMSKKSIYESALILSCWVRIRIRIRNADPDQVYKLFIYQQKITGSRSWFAMRKNAGSGLVSALNHCGSETLVC